MDKLGLDIASGNMPGWTGLNKFGRNPEIDTANASDIWTYGGATAPRQQYTYPFIAAAAALYISSSDAGDKQVYTVYGLDADWKAQVQNVTANGQTKTEIGTGLTWIRVHRVVNIGATVNAGAVYVYEDVAPSSGVPAAAKVRAHIEIGQNQTLMAVYSTAANTTAYLIHLWGSMNRSVTTGSADVTLYVRPFGQVFQVKYVIGLVGTGSGKLDQYFDPPLVIQPKSDIKVYAAASANDTDLSAGFDMYENYHGA